AAVSFAGLDAASIFPGGHDPFDDRIAASPGRVGARQELLRRAGAQRRRVRGAGRVAIRCAAGSGRGGARDQRLARPGRPDARARLDVVLRPGAGPLLHDLAARVRGGGRVTAVADRFAVRVMVTDVWDQVFLAVGPDTTVADLKRQAL